MDLEQSVGATHEEAEDKNQPGVLEEVWPAAQKAGARN